MTTNQTIDGVLTAADELEGLLRRAKTYGGLTPAEGGGDD